MQVYAHSRNPFGRAPTELFHTTKTNKNLKFYKNEENIICLFTA